MSMVEKLKKNRMIKYLYNKKSKGDIYNDLKKRKLNLLKSNSFTFKTETNDNNNIMPLLALKNHDNNKIESKLRNNNTKLQLSLNKIKKELILAKSIEHKKTFELKQKEKLLNTAINIKKLNLDSEQGNYLSTYSFNQFQKDKENEIIEESFKSNLISKIKKEYLILEKEYESKVVEISKLKQNLKHCQNRELMTKNQKLMNDLIEIKNNYDIGLRKNNEYKIKMRDYIELEEKLTKKNFFILQLQESLKEVTNNNINKENEIEELKTKLKFLETENNNLNKQYEVLTENYNKVLINKKEIENKYSILIDQEK